MILIVSEAEDYSTLEVIRWLNHFGIKYIRINGSDKLALQELDMEDNKVIIKVDDQQLNFNEITGAWYRRGKFRFEGSGQNTFWKNFEEKESDLLNSYLFRRLSLKENLIGNYFTSMVNKLSVLDEAKASGLNIPKTFISSNKDRLRLFLQSCESAITKTVGTPITKRNRDNTEIQMGYTEDIGIDDLYTSDHDCFPSLIQEKIEKKYEIRSFFLNDQFYSMAIFSQNNLKTKTDFRKYDNIKPNRTIPYRLPKEIELKLMILFKKLNQNSGSVDLIFSSQNQYIFLEINPVGQFGMVSKPCNYFLERLIAQTLKGEKHQN